MPDTGLNTQEAQDLLKKYGFNELPETPPPSNISLIFSQLKSPLVYILVFAGLVTFFLHEFTDTLVISLAVLLNTVLGFIQEKRAGQALRALKELIHPEARVIRDGRMQTIEARVIVPGDLVVLNKGDKVPAEGDLVFSNRLFLTEAMLTGESVPIEKKKGDVVYMGTVVSAGQARFVTRKTGSTTEIGKIAESLDMLEEQTPLRRQLVHFSKQLSTLVILLTVGVFITGLLLGISPREIFTTSVALAVSAIPEGLLVGLTVILAIGMQRILAKKGLVRNLVSAETLGGVTTICVDKTGTLTQGKMQVVDVIGNEENLKMQTVLANDLDDPVVIAAFEWGSTNKSFDEKKYERIDSIPFTSENKFFASLHNFDDKSNLLLVNGAPEILMAQSQLTLNEVDVLYKQIEELTSQGKRVLGFSRKYVPHEKTELSNSDIEESLEWVGLIAFSDPVRTDVKAALKKTKKAGIKLMVITGDYPKTAISVLKQVGIDVDETNIILGSELDQLDDEALAKRMYDDNHVKVFARTKPEQKLKIVKVLKGRNEVVAMMGDGVNDAPALSAADIGVVVGEATDVAKESADLVLLDSSFNTIVLAIEEGRGIFDNLRKMILYLMCDAFIEIIVVFTAILVRLPLPITAAQILWVNLVSDGFPSLALTIDPKDAGIMDRTPRSPKEPLVAPWMMKLIAIVSIFGGAAAFFLFFYAYSQTGDIVFA
ncbi:cation-translocating P-type ATPase, partial [Patescibacteria group bacterium]